MTDKRSHSTGAERQIKYAKDRQPEELVIADLPMDMEYRPESDCRSDETDHRENRLESISF